jgi:[acyl-carrier-protein] S-malonyltransferase
MSKLSFLFPGQASQYVGMGKDLYEKFEIAREIYQTANAILEFDVADVSFNGPENDLKQTRITQPAIFVHSVVVTLLLKEKNIKPFAVAGHSLGEYSALVAGCALGFEDALKIVKVRGELMQRAGEENPGTMAAIIGLDEKTIGEVCCTAWNDGVVQSANFNSPGQIVISGSVTGVRKAMELAKAKGAKRAIELEVSGAFHSPLMSSAKDRLKEILEATNFKDAEIPVYTNVTAKPLTKAGELRNLLIEQLTSPVRWQESIENMIKDGFAKFYEVGPGEVIKGLVKRINKTVECEAIGKYEQLI